MQAFTTLLCLAMLKLRRSGYLELPWVFCCHELLLLLSRCPSSTPSSESLDANSETNFSSSLTVVQQESLHCSLAVACSVSKDTYEHVIVGKRVMIRFKAIQKAYTETKQLESVQCTVNGNPNPILTVPHHFPIACPPAVGAVPLLGPDVNRLQALHTYMPIA